MPDIEETKQKIKRILNIINSKHPKLNTGSFVGINKWINHSAWVETNNGFILITGEALKDLDDYETLVEYTKVMVESYEKK